ARVNDAGAHLVGAELIERVDDRLDRTLDVALDDQRELLEPCGLELRHHLFERSALARLTGNGLLTRLALAILRDLAGTRLGIHHGVLVAGLGRALKPESLCRSGRAGLADPSGAIVDERALPAPPIAGDEHVARFPRAVRHPHGRDRAATL